MTERRAPDDLLEQPDAVDDLVEVDAGIAVIEIGLHDSQSWCLPHEMETDIAKIKRLWPQVKQFHLHLHNARGMALPSMYAALRTLDVSDTLILEGTLGGIGGGQFGGNGRASAMAPSVPSSISVSLASSVRRAAYIDGSAMPRALCMCRRSEEHTSELQSL